MELQLLFDEFAHGIVREKGLDTAERLSPWSAAVKHRLVLQGKRHGYATFANDDRRKSAAYLWDVAWCVEDGKRRNAPPTGAGVPHLQFPITAYRRLVLTGEVEWGRQGRRSGTRVYQLNLEEVFRDFYKLMDARSTTKVMVYTTWSFPEQGGEAGHFLQGFRQILLDYEGHQPGDQYLMIEFDDLGRQVLGWATEAPQRGPKAFRIRSLGGVEYPARWTPAPR